MGSPEESGHPHLEEVRPVAHFLLHWLQCFEQRNHCTLEEARRQWWNLQISELPERETHIAGCLCRQKDQKATLKYLCSGDVFLDQTAAAGDACSDCIPYVGSLCMWSLPETAPSMEKGFALGCISTEDYWVMQVRIWKERPFTMSWDNVVDYMKPTTFHSIARWCSRAGDTVHYAYSMNYPCETRGANIMAWGT
ncbi:hypothetical protein AK812_SmicGene25959 [Symbiodinium microadriaticum]|uniref:Uncharacterized protein n=1 Tax=Symbiodinium microadriaticum TaxID=2951 RepID=A0A1Q9DAP8_SYMMI|nr:hypothetical protein AK812_SmicGene25959 [Symbiodinium microadriaticum]